TSRSLVPIVPETTGMTIVPRTSCANARKWLCEQGQMAVALPGQFCRAESNWAGIDLKGGSFLCRRLACWCKNGSDFLGAPQLDNGKDRTPPYKSGLADQGIRRLTVHWPPPNSNPGAGSLVSG